MMGKALSPGGNPEFSTVLKVVKALGLRLHATGEHGARTLASKTAKYAVK